MGGFSRGRIVSTDQETALFTGNLSLANNGGFASVRKLLSKPLGVDVDGLVIRVKGDGKRYRVRLYMNDRFEAVSYQAAFDTIRGKWVYIRIRTNAFYPSYRGRFVRNAPVLEPRKIQQIGFVIADKQSGPFSLELDRIVAYRKERRRK